MSKKITFFEDGTVLEELTNGGGKLVSLRIIVGCDEINRTLAELQKQVKMPPMAAENQ